MSSRRSVATAMHTAQMMIADRYRIMLSGRLNQADEAAPRMRFFSYLDILCFGSEKIVGKYGMVVRVYRGLGLAVLREEHAGDFVACMVSPENLLDYIDLNKSSSSII